MATAAASFMRRCSSATALTVTSPSSHTAAAAATASTTSPVAVDADELVHALTAFFLPEPAAATTEAAAADMTESLLTFHVPDATFEDEEYDLPVSILPMSPEPSPRARSASALSQAAIGSAAAALTSWFSFEDFEGDEDALEDEYVDGVDEDFLMDDYQQRQVEPQHEDEMPTPAKLSLIAEEEYSAPASQPWSVKSLGWPWVRAN